LVDRQCEIGFSTPQGTLPRQPILLALCNELSFSDIQLMALACGKRREVVRVGRCTGRRLVAQPGGLTLGFALRVDDDW